jgi:hypothetical protein
MADPTVCVKTALHCRRPLDGKTQSAARDGKPHHVSEGKCGHAVEFGGGLNVVVTSMPRHVHTRSALRQGSAGNRMAAGADAAPNTLMTDQSSGGR